MTENYIVVFHEPAKNLEGAQIISIHPDKQAAKYAVTKHASKVQQSPGDKSALTIYKISPEKVYSFYKKDLGHIKTPRTAVPAGGQPSSVHEPATASAASPKASGKSSIAQKLAAKAAKAPSPEKAEAPKK
jgi:hypothetical protein